MARALHRRGGMNPPNAVQWHDARRRRLLAAHPEARALVGRNPWSAPIVVALVALQLGLAVAAACLPWWAVPLLAWCVGAVSAHALSTFIHECAHDLVFRGAAANRALSLLANVPLVMPGAIDFRDKHLAHHRHLGELDADTQAPPQSDLAYAVTPLRCVLWHCFAPLYGTPAQLKRDRWLVANVVVQLAALAPFTWLAGPQALVFLVLSGWFAFGPHPVGARRYGEHLALEPGQPTASYYGPLNRLSFDVGFHVEHHDLPSVPWSGLRALRALAPELYAPLAYHASWSALLWQLFTRRGEGPARYFVSPRGRSRPG
jgi:sphingolipid delta-4 desaturase